MKLGLHQEQSGKVVQQGYAWLQSWVHLATRKPEQIPADIVGQKLAVLSTDVELTPAQREVLCSFLFLLLVKLSRSNEITPDSETNTLCLDELQRLVAVAKQ